MTYMSSIAHPDGPLLYDLLPSLGAHQGVSGFTEDRIGVPAAQRYVVVLVDGLGWEILLRAAMDAPYLSGLIGDAVKTTVGLPSTTASSLTSLWTGVPAGWHGVMGFSFREHLASAELFVPLWADQPIPTADSVLDWMVTDGVAVSCVVPPDHVNSGLTAMSTRQANLIGVDPADNHGRIEAIASAARAGQRSLVYVYDSRLDHDGHKYGVASDQWRGTLTLIDAWLEELRAGLDDDVRLVVTGDHGMVDVAEEDRVIIDSEPLLAEGVRLAAGDVRFRHLYTDSPEAVAQRWRTRLGDQATVLTRREAVAAGLFGTVADRYLHRIGDVVAIPENNQAYLSRSFPGEFHLVGMHGGTSSAERYVPVLVD